jgi:hypothetical protein
LRGGDSNPISLANLRHPLRDMGLDVSSNYDENGNEMVRLRSSKDGYGVTIQLECVFSISR